MEQTAVSTQDQLDQKEETAPVLRAHHAERESPLELFNSTEANALRVEIIRTGRKLWDRQYVDGNGGNISVRLGAEFVLCTPTMLSKADLEAADICLSDLNGKILAGDRTLTSELLLHLEIYKTVPEAKAVIHCHPPYATAHAVAGVIPQSNLVPEQEVFIGLVALSPYETPGTHEFARTVHTLAKDHNTILLANHGIACWADTVTHAEWYAEIVETYCKTVMIAKQLRPELPEIPAGKIAELLALKKKLGMSLPDPRNAPEKTKTADRLAGTAVPAQIPVSTPLDAAETDRLVSRLTEEIAAFLQKSR